MKFARQSSTTIDMKGGIDENLPSMQMSPGTLIQCANYMIAEGSGGGYTSISGYERIDGTGKPSDSVMDLLRLYDSTVQINQGDLIEQGANSCTAIADGMLVDTEQKVEVDTISGTFVRREPLYVVGVNVGLSDNIITPNPTADFHDTYENKRDTVSKVGGVACEGSVLSLYIFEDEIYAFRKKVGVLEVGMYKEDATTGWIEVDTSADPLVYVEGEHSFSFTTYNFYANTDSNSFYWTDKVNQCRGYDGEVVITISNCGMAGLANPWSDSQADNDVCVQLTKLDPHWANILELKVTTPSVVKEDWLEVTVVNQAFRDFFDLHGARVKMKIDDGVTVYPVFLFISSTDAVTITVDGEAATAADHTVYIYYDENQIENVPTGDPPIATTVITVNEVIDRDFTVVQRIDRPIELAAKSNRLFLAYEGGSLQYSELGEPSQWNGVYNAGELGMGDEITDLTVGVGGVLVIFMDDNISLLSGDTPLNWKIDQFSRKSGAYFGTPKRLLGTIFFMDDRGLTTMESVQEFGDYGANAISAKFKKTILANKELGTTATVSRELNQYRLFFSNGKGIIISFQGKQLQGATFIEYPISVDHVAEGSLGARDSSIIFSSHVGTVDTEDVEGYVYLMDSGTSFDNYPIITKAETSYYHFRTPRKWKRFLSVMVEAQAGFDIDFDFKIKYDYDTTDLPLTQWISGSAGNLSSSQSEYGSAIYGEAVYGTTPITNRHPIYLMGYGTTASFKMLTNDKYNIPHTIQNLLVDYTINSRRI